jgi:hypothetical protein
MCGKAWAQKPPSAIKRVWLRRYLAIGVEIPGNGFGIRIGGPADEDKGELRAIWSAILRSF